MAKPRSDPLRLIDTIYRFPGGLRGPGEVEIERPITLVHDVSRAASQHPVVYIDGSFLVVTAGAGAAGYSTRTADDIRTGAFATALRNAGLTVSNSDLWLVGYDAAVTAASAANFSLITAGILPPFGASIPFQFVAFGNRSTTSFDVTSGGERAIRYQDDPATATTSINSLFRLSAVRLPVRFKELQVRTQDNAGGAVTVRHKPIYAIAPKGVIPSGFQAV